MKTHLRGAIAIGAALLTLGFPAVATASPEPAAPSGQVGALALPSYDTWIADVTVVTNQAAQYLRTRLLPDPASRTAIVLDIDNTALQTNYRPAIETPATGPVLDIARQAAGSGAAVFFVTARPEILRWATEGNLKSVGYPVAGLSMRPWFNFDSDDKLKTDARKAIEKQGYTIVANIGNNDTDLVGGHAECTFKLPDYDKQLS